MLGNPLPIQYEQATSVQYGDTFAIIGGYGYLPNPHQHDTVYVYEPATDSWRLIPKRLTQKKWSMGAFTVDKSIFPECF